VDEYGSSQNNFPIWIHAVPLLGIKVNIVCAKRETRITEHNFFFLRPKFTLIMFPYHFWTCASLWQNLCLF
jgi:hypothetical protein